MKGVILAGGKGTRLAPLTKIINKHLLPVGPYPMIYWSILKLKEAGIQDILIVTNKHDLDNFKKLIGIGEEFQVDITYSIQDGSQGIAHALHYAKNFVREENFVLLLGDNLFEDSLMPFIKAFSSQGNGARILLKEVKDPSRYGVPVFNEKNIIALKEKPTSFYSSYCVTGIYMYDPQVFNFLDHIHPSSRGELEITDLNNLYINQNEMKYDILQGWWVDAGTHESLYEANSLVYQHMLGEETKRNE